MSMTKTLAAAFAGTVVLLLLGFVIYEVLLKDFMMANLGSATNGFREEPIMWAIIVSHIGLGVLLTMILSRGAGAKSAAEGAKVAAVVGLFLAIAVDFDYYAVTNLFNLKVALVDTLVWMVRLGIGGAVIGFMLGRE